MYAFDVHCNSYFPLFLLLYGAHGSRQGQLGMGFVRALPVQRSGTLHQRNNTACSVALTDHSQLASALCPVPCVRTEHGWLHGTQHDCSCMAVVSQLLISCEG